MALVHQIPAQAVVESDLTRELPGVLKEQAPARIAPLRILRSVHRAVVHGPQQEAGVREPDASSTQILTLCGREPRLVGGEVQHAAGPARIAVRVAFQPVLATNLVSVIALDPGNAQRRGQLAIPVVIGVRRAHAEHAALVRG